MSIQWKPEFEDHHNPMIRCHDDTQDLMSLLMTSVQKAIGEELDKRDIKPGSIASLHVDFYEKSPSRIGITFNVHLRGPDDIVIEFRGVQ